jgi:hypothetical protein
MTTLASTWRADFYGGSVADEINTAHWRPPAQPHHFANETGQPLSFWTADEQLVELTAAQRAPVPIARRLDERRRFDATSHRAGRSSSSAASSPPLDSTVVDDSVAFLLHGPFVAIRGVPLSRVGVRCVQVSKKQTLYGVSSLIKYHS